MDTIGFDSLNKLSRKKMPRWIGAENVPVKAIVDELAEYRWRRKTGNRSRIGLNFVRDDADAKIAEKIIQDRSS